PALLSQVTSRHAENHLRHKVIRNNTTNRLISSAEPASSRLMHIDFPVTAVTVPRCLSITTNATTTAMSRLREEQRIAMSRFREGPRREMRRLREDQRIPTPLSPRRPPGGAGAPRQNRPAHRGTAPRRLCSAPGLLRSSWLPHSPTWE